MSDPTPAQGEHAPLWTPQSFVAAFQSYEQGDIDRFDAIAAVVVTMIRQYEAALDSLRQELAERNEHVATLKAERSMLSTWLNATNDLLNEEEEATS